MSPLERQVGRYVCVAIRETGWEICPCQSNRLGDMSVSPLERQVGRYVRVIISSVPFFFIR